MAKTTRICKNCGKPYEYCHTQMPRNSKTYRWQDVACSPECGEKYLAAVLAARAAELAALEDKNTEQVDEEPKKSEEDVEVPASAKVRSRKSLKEKSEE